MKITDIKIEPSPGPLVLATPRQVDELEARLWITFPPGYREYVTQIGEGELGEFVKVYPPWRVDRELAEWRSRIDKYWLWDKGKGVLPKARALECVVVGDTGNGDELVFHPRYPDRLFVLTGRGSSGDGEIFVVGSDLLSAIEWMCSSGRLTRRFKDRTLRPFDSRRDEPELKEVADPPGESLDDIVKLGRDWARRHRARKTLYDDLPVGKGTATFIYEAIVLEGRQGLDGEEPGYLAVFRVDKPDGKVRIYNCHVTEESSGYHDGDIVGRGLPDEDEDEDDDDD
jgi:hypothetical protein